MINLQTEHYGAFLGDGGWKDQIRREMLSRMCVSSEGTLSEDERVTDFVVLHPQQARVEDGLLNLIAEARQTVASGQTLVLLRWKDDVESLVVFPANSLVPSPELLIDAYIGGFVTEFTRLRINEQWDTP